MKKQLEEQNRILNTPTSNNTVTAPNVPLVDLSNDTSLSTGATTEIPLPEPPKYEPKEIKKPRSGGSINFEKQERPSREKNE